ncbi:tetratricopeptide repeat protein, partial [Angustibacter peucedani]
FARARLAEDPDGDTTRRRHAEYYCRFAERWGPQLRGEAFVMAREAIEFHLDNLRAALRWTLRVEEPGTAPDPDDVAVALRICHQLSWFWYACGYQDEGRRWLSRAVEAAHGRESTELMVSLHGLAVLMLQHGEADQARETLERCLAYWQRVGDPGRESMELNSLGVAHRSLGDPSTAIDLLTRAVEVARAAGVRERLANPLSNLATVESDVGNHDRAIVLLQEVSEIDAELGDTWGLAVDQINIAGLMVRSGRTAEARDQLAAHAPDAVALGDVDLTLDIVDLACVVASDSGEWREAARLSGASDALRAAHELPLPLPDREQVDAKLAVARGHAGAEEWDRWVAEGGALRLDAAVAEALAGVGAPAASMDA